MREGRVDAVLAAGLLALTAAQLDASGATRLVAVSALIAAAATGLRRHAPLTAAAVAVAAVAVLVAVAPRATDVPETTLVAGERGRIARELHDAVVHSLSVIAIQATAGRHLARTAPDRVPATLDAIEATGRDARAEVRRLRDVLDADDQPGLGAVPALVHRAAQASVEVRLLGDGPTQPIGQAVDRAAYCVVREALTNAMRHAPGAEVLVRFEQFDDRLLVEIRNGPAGGEVTRPVPDTGGRGLDGLRARVRTAGAELAAGPVGCGWRVAAWFPVRG